MFKSRNGVRDVVVMLTVGALTTGFVSAVVVNKREAANRMKCASHLKQMGLAIALYANENRGAYPRTSYNPGDAPVWGTPYETKKDLKANPNAHAFADEKSPGFATRPADNDVTAAIFLLFRTQDLSNDVAVCPSSRLKAWDYGGEEHGTRRWTNWQGHNGLAKHLSYSYQNPYPTAEAVSRGFKLNSFISAEFAVMADMNPGSDAVTKVKVDSPLEEMRKANSFNHGGEGQNVLYGDGHVEFVTTPFAGTWRDNIYTSNGGEVKPRVKPAATVIASPIDAEDSILLPTTAAIGQTIELLDDATLDKLEAEELAKAAELNKAVLGNYVRIGPKGDRSTLSLEEGKFTLVSGPMTLQYNMQSVGNANGKMMFVLTAKDMAPFDLTIRQNPDGSLLLDPPGFFMHGEWLTADQAATRPAQVPTSQPSR